MGLSAACGRLIDCNIDFPKCRREIATSLNDFSNRWFRRENVKT